jgi:two-component system CheB/CheR fusion protein
MLGQDGKRRDSRSARGERDRDPALLDDRFHFSASTVTQATRRYIPHWFTERAPVRGMPALPAPPSRGPKATRLVEQFVLSRHTSACVAINQRLEILYFFGPTHDYLVQPTGEVRMDLLSWARSGLYPKLRSALNEAIERRERVTIEDMRIERDGGSHPVECTIEPILPLTGAEGLFLVAFRDRPEVSTGPLALPAEPRDPAVRQLEGELKEARQELQNTIEQLDSANEEHRASHEELLSLNEELQSSNEELESSKEELQSLNEEMVTINHQLEEKNGELRATNADLNNLFATTEIPMIFLSRDLSIRRFTPAATTVMRLVRSDVGRSIEHIKGRFHDEQLLTDCASVLEKLSPSTAEVVSEEGRWYVRRIIPYRAEDDRIDGVSISFTDITHQKEAAAEIEEARKYSRAIVETIDTPLLVLSADFAVLSANRAFFETFRVSSAETVNRKVFDLGNRQWDIPALRDLLLKVLPEAKEIRAYEVTHSFEAIGPRIMRLNARLMHRAERPTLILLAIEDITARANAERLAEEHAAALAEEHHRKDEFLAMLGHELRNPLSALLHGISLLDKVSEDRAKGIREMMLRQTTRIVSMLDQLLDIARVISGKFKLSKTRIDAAEAVRVAVETVKPLVEAQKHTLNVSSPPEKSVFVMGDAIRLAQVVENLLTNAVKYTNPGGQIGVALEADEEKVQIIVRDNGMGIAPEFLPHVFEVFTQSPRALDRAKGGLGLGLPLVQRLVEMHGGEVKASSPGLGQGSEFAVTLPRLAERRSRERSDRPSQMRKFRPHRILVVDDEEDTARGLADLLGAEGHETLAVNDGPAALDVLHTFDPDVLLVDLGLPTMDGYEVARKIREEDSHRRLVIAVTGYPSDADRLKQAGFNGHLMKPPNLQTLSTWLADWDRGGRAPS